MQAPMQILFRIQTGQRPRLNSWAGTITTFAISAFLVLFTFIDADADVTVLSCKGAIKSHFETLNVDARWDVEWPVKIDNVSTDIVNAIRVQICDDAFIDPFMQGGDNRLAMHYARPDIAQAIVFLGSLEKIKEKEQSYVMRSLDFVANLKIRFVTGGYLGYTLSGCQNEGGNGCHSYVVARVIALATGGSLLEREFISSNKFQALGNVIAKKICVARRLKPLVDAAPVEIFDNGNFIFEKGGIRWYLPAYSVFPGCDGVQSALVTWDELKPFFNDGRRLNAFRKLDYSRKKVIISRDSVN